MRKLYPFCGLVCLIDLKRSGFPERILICPCDPIVSIPLGYIHRMITLSLPEVNLLLVDAVWVVLDRPYCFLVYMGGQLSPSLKMESKAPCEM